MASVVVQIGETKFYVMLLDQAGALIPAEYLKMPDGGDAQRLRLDGRLLTPRSRVQIKGEGGVWLPASIAEVGEFTRSLTILIERPTSKLATALMRSLPKTLFVCWSQKERKIA